MRMLLRRQEPWAQPRMTWDGFLPPGMTCLHCGAELAGVYSGRPAESYLGTYNGLCYRCTGRAAFAVRVELLDRATWWEWPPHCPSWRRARETFVGYAGCEHCGGQGRIMKPRYSAGGGSYAANCKPCMDRYRAHPVRVRHKARRTRLHAAADRAWKNACARQIPAGTGLAKVLCPDPDAVRSQLATEYLDRLRSAVARFAWA